MRKTNQAAMQQAANANAYRLNSLLHQTECQSGIAPFGHPGRAESENVDATRRIGLVLSLVHIVGAGAGNRIAHDFEVHR